jgi:hypothetical protein
MTGTPQIFVTRGSTVNTVSLDNSKALATFQEQGYYFVLFSGAVNSTGVDNTSEVDLAGLKTATSGILRGM